jgi:hypothetical protein
LTKLFTLVVDTWTQIVLLVCQCKRFRAASTIWLKYDCRSSCFC